MFCPPLSTPPAEASGDACSLMSAIFFNKAPPPVLAEEQLAFRCSGRSAARAAGRRFAPFTEVA
jgi:hypothetical protein